MEKCLHEIFIKKEFGDFCRVNRLDMSAFFDNIFKIHFFEKIEKSIFYLNFIPKYCC